MRNYKKFFLSQIVLLATILAASYLILSWYSAWKDQFDYTANGMLLDLAIGAVIFVLCFVLFPLLLLYYMRIKRKIDINNLNLIFTAIVWFLIIVITACFISILWELFYDSWSELSFWDNLKISFLYHFSWTYLSNAEYGIIDDIKQVVIFSPHLAVAVLLYFALKNNKFLSKAIQEYSLKTA